MPLPPTTCIPFVLCHMTFSTHHLPKIHKLDHWSTSTKTSGLMTHGFTTLCITHKSFDLYTICALQTSYYFFILFFIWKRGNKGRGNWQHVTSVLSRIRTCVRCRKCSSWTHILNYLYFLYSWTSLGLEIENSVEFFRFRAHKLEVSIFWEILVLQRPPSVKIKCKL